MPASVPGSQFFSQLILRISPLFYALHAPSTRMRINFAATEDAQFWGKFAKQRECLLRQG